MSVYVVRNAMGETTGKVHLRRFGGTPACTVLFQDSDYNGVLRRIRMTHVETRVTCKRCRRILDKRK